MKTQGIAALAFWAALFFMAGCGQEAPPEPKAPLVKYETVRFGDEAASSSYAATVRGRYETAPFRWGDKSSHAAQRLGIGCGRGMSS